MTCPAEGDPNVYKKDLKYQYEYAKVLIRAFGMADYSLSCPLNNLSHTFADLGYAVKTFKFIFQFPECLAVNKWDTRELLHHLAYGRLGDGADVSHPSLEVGLHLVNLNARTHRPTFVLECATSIDEETAVSKTKPGFLRCDSLQELSCIAFFHGKINPFMYFPSFFHIFVVAFRASVRSNTALPRGLA